MSKIGAEMDQLQSLGQSFTRESQDVARLSAAITGQMQNTVWDGPAANRFRTQWEGEFRPTLTRLQQALQEANQEIVRRHQALHVAGT